MNVTLITAAISAALGFGAAWQIQGHFLIKKDLEQANERIAIQRAARATIERTTSAVIQAQNAAAHRAVVLRRDADAARAGLDGLRQSADTALRAAASGLDACNAVVAAYGVVLAEGGAFIQDVARAADQCLSDHQTLKDAWVTGLPKP